MSRPPDTEFVEMFGQHMPEFWSVFSKLKKGDVSGILRRRADFPHSEFHRKQAALSSCLVARELGLSEAEIKTCFYGGLWHDIGREFADNSNLGEENHPLASLIGTYLVRHEQVDNEVSSLTDLSDAIARHNSDVLPQDVKLTTRIVRDCDRIAGMGWSGIIRDAYYLGFRHPLFTRRSQFEVAEDPVFCDARDPWDPDYESQAREFVLENVLHFVLERDKTVEMFYQCLLWMWRYTGLEDYSGEVLIDPIMLKTQGLYFRRHLATVQFIDILYAQISPANIGEVVDIADEKYLKGVADTPRYIDSILDFASRERIGWNRSSLAKVDG